jgi:MFS transporter, Spinster family, sphingosine-1-phosphate transporter
MPRQSYKWWVVFVFFLFMLLHNADKNIIGQLLTDITKDFGITGAQAGLLGTGALVVGAIFYPIWGYLYDRYGRAKLVALASLIWGSTTMFGAVAPNYGSFLAARSSTGIDDASYPGVYSLISDYVGPAIRGKIYGVMQLTAPVGYLLSIVLVTVLGSGNWRNIFYITGGLGIAVAVLIFFTVREMPRGNAEPELEGNAEAAAHKFQLRDLAGIFQRRTIIPLFLQGFFGVFPLNVMTFWFFSYLNSGPVVTADNPYIGRGYDDGLTAGIMAGAVTAMAVGAFVGGAVGDWLFKRTKRGRLIMSATGVFMAAILMYITLNIPNDQPTLFGVLLTCTAFFVLFSGPNVVATVYDITVPEVRSSALSIQYFVENIGAASAPLIVGLLATNFFGESLQMPILIVGVSTYVLCGLFLLVAIATLPPDLQALRDTLAQRAKDAGIAKKNKNDD